MAVAPTAPLQHLLSLHRVWETVLCQMHTFYHADYRSARKFIFSTVNAPLNETLQSMQFTLGVDFEVLNVEYRVNFPRGQSIGNPKISLQPYFIMRRCTYVYKQKKFARHLQHTLLNWRGSQSLFGRFSSHLVEGGFPKICSILHLAKEASCPTKSLIRAGEARVKRVSMSAITNSRWEAGGQWLYQSDFL